MAAVIQRRGISVCAACGTPRAGTVTLGGKRASIVPASASGRDASTSAMLARSRGRAQRGLGILSLASGVLGAMLAAALFTGGIGLALALLVGLVGVGLGALSIRAGARSMQRADAGERLARESAVLELAEEHGGRLTASDVARAFGMPTKSADALLTRMVGDGSRVSVDVDDEGVLRYVFQPAAPSVRLRVEESESSEDEPETVEAAPERRRRSPRDPD